MENKKSTLYRIVDSLGLIGNKEAVSILERLIESNHKYKLKVSEYSIARALYFLTGKLYAYNDNHSGKKSIVITESLENPRKVIENTRGRKRTFNEMLVLDKVFRHPDF